MKHAIVLVALCFSILAVPGEAQNTALVVINEVAWAGTAASVNDEWIELFNNSDRDVDLTGWVLRWEGKVVHFGPAPEGADNNALEVRRAIVPARGYYLMERTDDTTVNDIEADLIYTGGLRNGGETLELVDPAGNVVDTANAPLEEGWLAGTAGTDEMLPYATMERINGRGPDRADNWASNTGSPRNGLDAAGNPLNGTPKARNSAR